MAIYDTQTLTNTYSMAADFFSAAHEVQYHDMGAMQMVWTGADTSDQGEFIPQASVDGACWCDLIDGAFVKVVDAVDGCHLYEFTSLGYKWLRLKFLHGTNSTGSVIVYSFIKRRRTSLG